MLFQGATPEFGKFGEGNVGFTGLFEVKKKARRQGEDDLSFPEPLEPINFEKPKHGLNSEEKPVSLH